MAFVDGEIPFPDGFHPKPTAAVDKTYQFVHWLVNSWDGLDKQDASTSKLLIQALHTKIQAVGNMVIKARCALMGEKYGFKAVSTEDRPIATETEQGIEKLTGVCVIPGFTNLRETGFLNGIRKPEVLGGFPKEDENAVIHL